MKTPRKQGEVLEKLVEQLDALSSSCLAYDRGEAFEGDRIATTIRVLFHNTQQSHGLMKQCGLQGDMLTSVSKDESTYLFNELTFVDAEPLKNFAQVLPYLDEAHVKQFVDVQRWWNLEKVASYGPTEGQKYTRKKIVLDIANTDGGAHVDPEVPASLVRLKTILTAGFFDDEAFPLKNLHRSCCRQIAHEVLRSPFLKDYIPSTYPHKLLPKKKGNYWLVISVE